MLTDTCWKRKLNWISTLATSQLANTIVILTVKCPQTSSPPYILPTIVIPSKQACLSWNEVETMRWHLPLQPATNPQPLLHLRASSITSLPVKNPVKGSGNGQLLHSYLEAHTCPIRSFTLPDNLSSLCIFNSCFSFCYS